MASKFFERFFSSIAIFFIFLFCLFANSNGYHVVFYIIISLLIAGSSFEWFNITKFSLPMMPIAFFLIIIPNASLMYIYSQPYGPKIIFWLIMCIWSVDVSAYIVGNLYGGSKLLPSVSPGKTWSGLIGGVVGSVTISIFISLYNGLFSFLNSVLLGIVIALLGQAGDLIESFIKRVVGVKDSGSIIPGHGGILDRVDGFVLSSPFVACFIKKFLVM